MGASAFDLPQDKRDNKRQRLLLTAAMECGRGLIEVHLLNISHTGAKLDAETPPARGEVVTLIQDGLRVGGTVAWVEETRFGVAFDHAIDAQALVERGQRHLRG